VSHVVTIKAEIRDPAALRLACQRLKLDEPKYETVRLFSGQATGWTVKLPDWQYPVVANTDTGQIAFDNFGGRWGNDAELQHLLQSYAIEKTKLEARRKGYAVTECPLADGSIKLSVLIAGGTG
jgi:hypothetical protein